MRPLCPVQTETCFEIPAELCGSRNFEIESLYSRLVKGHGRTASRFNAKSINFPLASSINVRWARAASTGLIRFANLSSRLHTHSKSRAPKAIELGPYCILGISGYYRDNNIQYFHRALYLLLLSMACTLVSRHFELRRCNNEPQMRPLSRPISFPPPARHSPREGHDASAPATAANRHVRPRPSSVIVLDGKTLL